MSLIDGRDCPNPQVTLGRSQYDGEAQAAGFPTDTAISTQISLRGIESRPRVGQGGNRNGVCGITMPEVGPRESDSESQFVINVK